MSRFTIDEKVGIVDSRALAHINVDETRECTSLCSILFIFGLASTWLCVSLKIKKKQLQYKWIFHPCHMDLVHVRVAGHMTWGSDDRNWSRMGGWTTWPRSRLRVGEFSLNATYFVCHGVFYHQIKGDHRVTHLTRGSKPGNEGLCGEGLGQCSDQTACLVLLHGWDIHDPVWVCHPGIHWAHQLSMGTHQIHNWGKTGWPATFLRHPGDTEWWWHTEYQDLPQTYTHWPILELGLQPPPRAQEVGSPYPTT